MPKINTIPYELKLKDETITVQAQTLPLDKNHPGSIDDYPSKRKKPFWVSHQWVLTPALTGDGPNGEHKTVKVLTHWDSSFSAAYGIKNRKTALELWDKVKGMDIHYEDPDDIPESVKSELEKICYAYNWC